MPQIDETIQVTGDTRAQLRDAYMSCRDERDITLSPVNFPSFTLHGPTDRVQEVKTALADMRGITVREANA